MNIFGVSRKRKLDQLTEDVTELQSTQTTQDSTIASNNSQLTSFMAFAIPEFSNLQTGQQSLANDIAESKAESKSDALALQTQVDEIKTQITGLSEQDSDYWPGWYFAHSDVHTHDGATEGTASVSAGTAVRWGFSRPDSLNVDLYNYEIQYSIYQCNTGSQLYVGFCQKAVNGDARVETNYPTTSGWPDPTRTNNFGDSLIFRVTPSFTAWHTHDPDESVHYADPTQTVTSATNTVPWILKVVITDGRVSSMESSHNGVVQKDYIVTEGWDDMYVPSGPIHFCLLDTNNTSGGNSSWDFGITIKKRTIRVKPLSTAVKTYPTTITRSSALQRFIPYKAKVIELDRWDDIAGSLRGEVFFLPAAEHIGERLYITNNAVLTQSTLKVYNTLPDDPTSSTNTNWESFTLTPGQSSDFIAISTLKWRQIV